MALYQIKNFSEIDFVNVDAVQDRFILPNGEVYRFSDHICHYCWSGGTVLETDEGEKKYHCLQCGNKLAWSEFINDFLEPKGDTLEFLIPEHWTEEEKQQWYQDYKERRLAEEKIREDMLRFGKE